MFAVGHLALGYLSAKILQRFLKININLPLIFFLSLIPDVDILIPGLRHRSVTHSIIVLTLVFIPVFLSHRKRAIPYFAALTQHVLIGDFPTGTGVQMFWPLTSNWYGAGINIQSYTIISTEWISFLLAIIILTKTDDLKLLLKSQKSNLLLTVPSGALFLSSIVGFSIKAPIELLIPHLIFLTIFTLSIMKFLLKKSYVNRKATGT